MTYTDVNATTSHGPVRRHSIQHNGVRIVSEQPGVKKLLASDEDLEAFCSLPFQEDVGALSRESEGQLKPYLRERAEFPLECGAMMLDLGSPINTLCHAADLGIHPIGSITHRPLVEAWLNRRRTPF